MSQVRCEKAAAIPSLLAKLKELIDITCTDICPVKDCEADCSAIESAKYEIQCATCILATDVRCDTKTCSRCKVTKSVKDFYKNRTRKDGLRYWCKVCAEEYKNGYRRKLSLKKRMSKRPKKVLNRHEIIERKRAKDRIGYEIKIGRIVRPERCTTCTSTTDIQGHHPDYTKPLEVVWLCRKCHAAIHRAVIHRVRNKPTKED